MPKIADTYIDTRLTNISLAYTNDKYIHSQVLPVVPNIGKKTGKIPQLGTDHLRVMGSAKRSDFDEGSHRVDFQILSDKNYFIDDYDLEHFLPANYIKQAEKPFDAKRDGQLFLENLREQIMEKATADMLQSTSVMTNNTTPTTKWDAASGSTPFEDMEAAAEAIRIATGRRPNRCVIGAQVVSKLQTHADFISKLTGGGKLTILTKQQVLQIIKDFLGLDKILVGSALYESSKEGQTSSIAEIWGDNFVLYYVPSGPSLWTPSFGYRLIRAGMDKKIYVRPHSNPRLGLLMEIAWSYQDLVLDANSGYLISDVLT